MMTRGILSPTLSPAISTEKRAPIGELLDSRKASLMIQIVSDAEMARYTWHLSISFPHKAEWMFWTVSV